MSVRELLGALTKTGSGSAISMVLSVISSKIMAVITGPIGIGLYSMIQQLVQTASVTGTVGGGNVALTQGIASRKDQARDEFIVTVFWIFVVGAICSVLALTIFAPFIASIAFERNDEATVWLVRWIALPTVLMIGLLFLNGILNGFRAIGRLAIMQVAGSGVNALLAYPVSNLVQVGYWIAFVGLMSASISMQIVIGVLKAHKEGYLRPLIERRLRPMIIKEKARSFFHLAGTLLITGIIATVSILIIRAMIVQYGGLADAGIFNVAWVICMMYPTLVLGSFGTYYLPTLSQATDRENKITLMGDVFRLSTILITPLLLLMIVIKPLIIDLLYSMDFIASLTIVRWMLIGIYLKAAGWVFAMPLLAFPDMKVYFWTETFWYVGLIGFSLSAVVFLNDLEIIGMGYMVLYAAYLTYVMHYARTRHGFVLKKRSAIIWATGLLLIVFASAQTWSWIEIDTLIAAIWVAIIVVFTVLSLTKEERGQLKQILFKRELGS